MQLVNFLYCSYIYLMKCCLILLSMALGIVPLAAQDLTGIWRGSFVNTSDIIGEKYKYEIQVKQSPTHSLMGVTFSYSAFSKVFYGKADLQGIFMDQTGNLIFKENKMIEYKVSDASIPCLMTCYLQYHKEGKLEYLEGTYSSITISSGSDCGAGRVYLEKVTTTDFQKEDFLLRKNQRNPLRSKPGADDNLVDTAAGKPLAAAPRKKTPGVKKQPKDSTEIRKTPPPIAKAQPKKGTTTPPAKKPPLAATQPRTTAPKPGSKATAKTTPRDTLKNKPDASIAITGPNTSTAPPAVIEAPKPIPPPQIFSERENKLIKTIVTGSPFIKIQLYDNGEIDDDTITVYHNNEVVAYKKRLSNLPITINLGLKAGVNLHELVMVADNLGRIPPNTALMVVTTGGKRYELFISSNEQRNAKVVIEYKPGAE